MRISEDRSLLAFIFSLTLHGALLWALIYLATPQTNFNPSDQVEIEIKEGEPSRYIVGKVEETKEEKIEEKLKDKAQFLSNLTRRVKEQVRAHRGVKTKNGGKPQRPQPNFTFDPSSNANTKIPENLRNMAIGSSQFAERVPGIKEGSFNSLNTDQLTYYTFYNRINEQISYRWVSLVKNYLYRLPAEQLRRISNSNKRTVIEILLDQEGNYFSSLIHNSSGIQALDEATYKAFRLATPFVNSPQGLVNSEDGLIHLYYEFNVIFDPLPMAGPSGF